MSQPVSRRSVMVQAVALTSAICVARVSAAESQDLNPDDPLAKAFDFVTDAARVDARAHPTFQPGQRCSGCAQYLGKPEDASAPCDIFGGQRVPAGGWCKVWARR